MYCYLSFERHNRSYPHVRSFVQSLTNGLLSGGCRQYRVAVRLNQGSQSGAVSEAQHALLE